MAQPAVSPILQKDAGPAPFQTISAEYSGSRRVGDIVTPLSEPSTNFAQAVDDAMCLLLYAARTGRQVDEVTRTTVLNAKAVGNGWSDAQSAGLITALTKLAAQLHPVTADSLRASNSGLPRATIRSLQFWTILLAVLIFAFSLLSFVSSAISSTIRADITSANGLVVKLRSELGTSTAGAGTANTAIPKVLEADVITQLQLYASNMRAIDARSRQLNWFVLNSQRDPFGEYRWKRSHSKDPRQQKADYDQQTKNQEVLKKMFQLPVPLVDMPKTLEDLTNTYQGVRSFAQDVLDLVSVYYGAMTTCLLPILYALFGTCAYLLRSFEEELRTLTFLPSSRTNVARFLIAAIGGAVVGLFGNFTITQGASISPLAIAFLVGYAVDVFFSFLESLLQAFTKNTKNHVSLAGATASH